MIDILFILIFAPLLGAVCLSVVQSEHKDTYRNCRDVGMVTAVMVCVLSLYVFFSSDTFYNITLLPQIYLNYTVNANALSKYYILGISVATCLAIWSCYFTPSRNLKSFMFIMLMLEFFAINILVVDNIIIMLMIFEIVFYTIILQVYGVGRKQGRRNVLWLVLLSFLGMFTVLDIVFESKTANLGFLSFQSIPVNSWWILLVSFLWRLPLCVSDGWYRNISANVRLPYFVFLSVIFMQLGFYMIMRINLMTFGQVVDSCRVWLIVFALGCMMWAWIGIVRAVCVKSAIAKLVMGASALAVATVLVMSRDSVVLANYYIVSTAVAVSGLGAVCNMVCERYGSIKYVDIRTQSIRTPLCVFVAFMCVGSLGFAPLTAGFVVLVGMLDVWGAYHIFALASVGAGLLVASVGGIYILYVVFFSHTVSRKDTVVRMRRGEYGMMAMIFVIVLLQGIFFMEIVSPLQRYLSDLGIF